MCVFQRRIIMRQNYRVDKLKREYIKRRKDKNIYLTHAMLYIHGTNAQKAISSFY